MNDIKLIVTDMDGTFLNSNYEVSPDFPAIYKELKKRNILFVPASGRQMPGITQYFKEIENEIGFIAENGGYVIYKNEELFADRLENSFIKEIIETIREIPGARAVLSAQKKAYYESEDEKFVNYFTRYYTENQKVDDLTNELEDNTFKIAVYHPEGSEKNLYPYLKQFENKNLEVVVSGKYWVDIMNRNISKGKALEILQKKLNILPSETMAFGDYMNDITMLEKSKYSYAMENAHSSVKEAASFSALSNDEFGVLETISDYLKL
ncbi:Cof-type HAD-IIB family hydrolase [Chryseobacterium echinoideorum]|uniref:Cof-type HAD-IIB family hydrolase n=1 Tax=Chryseobacterium echinoideorum TaxID=1549648 RepID=UPI0011856520|nr:Cof-type HAD-IIB family hydrolase [Chryseobacterium echinoideorum]